MTEGHLRREAQELLDIGAPADGLADLVAITSYLWGRLRRSRGGHVGTAESAGGTQFVFAVPATDTVIRLECSAGLCSGADEARALAARAYQRAQEPANFVDPRAERPRPYVPLGNIKGRAERIWIPFERFWLPVR